MPVEWRQSYECGLIYLKYQETTAVFLMALKEDFPHQQPLVLSLVGPPSSTAPSPLSSSSTNTTSNFASELKCLRLNVCRLHRRTLFLHTFIWLLVGQKLLSTLLTSFFSMVCRSILKPKKLMCFIHMPNVPYVITVSD